MKRRNYNLRSKGNCEMDGENIEMLKLQLELKKVESEERQKEREFEERQKERELEERQKEREERQKEKEKWN